MAVSGMGVVVGGRGRGRGGLKVWKSMIEV